LRIILCVIYLLFVPPRQEHPLNFPNESAQ
jgi:hypothetical protein